MILFFFLFYTEGYAQYGFNKIFRFDSANRNYTIYKGLQIINDTIFAIGSAPVILNNKVHNSGIITKLNKEGNILWNQYYYDTLNSRNFDFSDDMLLRDKSNFITSAVNFDTSIGLMKIRWQDGSVQQKNIFALF